MNKKDQIDRESYILGGVQCSLGSAQLSSAEKLSVTLNDGFSAPFFLKEQNGLELVFYSIRSPIFRVSLS